MNSAEWTFIFDLAQAIGSLATAAGFAFIIRQTNLSKKQIYQTQQAMDNTLRPWVGLVDVRLQISNDNNNDVAMFTFKNYGQIPAKLLSVKIRWSKNKFSKEDLYSEQALDIGQHVYFPNQQWPFQITNEKCFMLSETEEFYFGILFEYEFPVLQGQKNCKYILIYQGIPVKNSQGKIYLDQSNQPLYYPLTIQTENEEILKKSNIKMQKKSLGFFR